MRRKHRLGKVALSHRSAAGHDYHVRRRQRIARRAFQRGQIVQPDSAVHHPAAGLRGQGRHAESHAFRDRIGAQMGLARGGQFVTRADNRDPWLERDGQNGPVRRRRRDHRAGGKPRSGLQQDIACSKVAPRRADVPGGAIAFGKAHPVSIAGRIFLHDAAVCAVRHRRAGEDPHGLTGGDCSGKALSGAAFANHGQVNPRARSGIDHGIAIHRRHGLPGRSAAGVKRLGQDAARRFAQRHLLVPQRMHRARDQGNRLVKGNHAQIPRRRGTWPAMEQGR